MNTQNTLRIYEKKGKKPYRYFFIRKELQPLFDNLGRFTFICSDGTQYGNLEVCISGEKQNYFIFVNDFFIEHAKLKEDEEIEFTIDREKRIVFLQILSYPLKREITETGTNDGKALERTIKIIKDSFKKYEWYYRLYEANVRAELVDPILKAIGWQPPYIRREEDRMDYILYGNDCFDKKSPKIVIEVKKYSEQLRSTGGCNTEIKYNNEQNQLFKYCKRENVQAIVGILTNGIRWCVYLKDNSNNYQYSGEINIENSSKDNIYRFFSLISPDNIETANQRNWKWLENTKRDEWRPSYISINGSEPDKYQKEAFIKVATMFIDKCYDSGKDPYSYCFSHTIIKDRQTHNSDYPYKDKGGKEYFINTYRGIYEQIILLQEINSRFDLGMSIKSY